MRETYLPFYTKLLAPSKPCTIDFLMMDTLMVLVLKTAFLSEAGIYITSIILSGIDLELLSSKVIGAIGCVMS
jgi:hypothetical protein